MSNIYKIPTKDEKEIRARDKTCVYCHKTMDDNPHLRGTTSDKATIEHLNNDGPFDNKKFVVICCGSCNASRGNKKLLDWFKTAYCINRGINEKTVAKPVRTYIQNYEKK